MRLYPSQRWPLVCFRAIYTHKHVQPKRGRAPGRRYTSTTKPLRRCRAPAGELHNRRNTTRRITPQANAGAASTTQSSPTKKTSISIHPTKSMPPSVTINHRRAGLICDSESNFETESFFVTGSLRQRSGGRKGRSPWNPSTTVNLRQRSHADIDAAVNGNDAIFENENAFRTLDNA